MKNHVKKIIRSIVLCLMLAGTCQAAPQEVKISKSGETSLRAEVSGRKIQINFLTTILKKSDPGFPLILSDYDEVSVVRKISIEVDGNPLAVPWSVYADLFNLRGAELASESGIFRLVTGGAGGADTYSVHIYFDSKRVIKREGYGAFPPYKPTEVTLYSPPLVLQ